MSEAEQNLAGPLSARHEAIPGEPGHDSHSEPGARGPQDTGPLLRRAVAYCIIVLLSVRIGLIAVSVLARRLPGSSPVGVPGWPAPRPTGWGAFVGTALERWDALWFLRIASDGYRLNDGSAAFWPGYPLLTRLLAALAGGHTLGAALVLSAGCTLGALILFYVLGTRELDEAVARRSVLYLALFPTAFFLAAPYSESMFLLLSLGAFLAARSKHWWTAVMCAVLASATRSVGVVLVLPLALEGLAQNRAHHRPGKLALATGSAACLSGAAVYLAFWLLRSDHWLWPFSSQHQWLRTASWPWSTLARATTFAWSYDALWHRADWVLFIPMLGLAAWSLGWLRESYSAYIWVSLIIILSFVFPGRPLMSAPRFLLALFPLFWALARLTEKKTMHRAVAVGLGAGQALLAAAFVAWYPIF